jgi:hypothetical protein
MNMLKLLMVSLILGASMSTSFADQPIRVTGCVVKGVEAGCLILRTITGKWYNISAARPRPVPDTYGEVQGVLKSGVVSYCLQGEVINPAEWTRKGRFCPK